ncbi:hypothetical protein BJX62DRAFT_11692 [Aspergillus germanicus]
MSRFPSLGPSGLDGFWGRLREDGNESCVQHPWTQQGDRIRSPGWRNYANQGKRQNLRFLQASWEELKLELIDPLTHSLWGPVLTFSPRFVFGFSSRVFSFLPFESSSFAFSIHLTPDFALFDSTQLSSLLWKCLYRPWTSRTSPSEPFTSWRTADPRSSSSPSSSSSSLPSSSPCVLSRAYGSFGGLRYTII